MATDSSLKKRKRTSETGSKPAKKVVIDLPAETVTIDGVLQPKTCPPVVAVVPGLQIPNGTPFNSYARPQSTKSKAGVKQDFVLHSQEHPSLSYTAKVEDARGSNAQLNHYVGVYDPKTGKMQVIAAKKMIMRGTVRAKEASAVAMGERDTEKTMMDMRTDLGQTFGTKKAKKALQDNVLNAISPQKKAGEPSAPMDGIGRAIFDSVGSITKDMATREELQAVVDDAKPVPRANLDAEDIQDVYDPEVIIGADILNLVPIQEWREKVKHKEGVQTPSRFVAARVNSLAVHEADTTRLRVLRYLQFVLIFYLQSKPGRQKGTRSIPQREKLQEILQPAPEAVIENIRRKFSDAGQMRKFHIDLLATHLCVFAAIVDNFVVDTQNLRDDLRMDPKTMNTYFREVGARVKPVSNKEQGSSTHVARLTLPLEFPKQRHIAPRR